MFVAYVFVFKAHSSPLNFSHSDESSSKVSFGFRLNSESEVSRGNEIAYLVYLCADHREQLYFVLPSQLSTAEVSSLIFKFDKHDPIELDEQFLRKLNNDRAYYLSYSAPTFDGNAPVRAVYGRLQRSSNLALYTSGNGGVELIAYLFDLEGTSAAMRKANNEGGCDMTHLKK